MKRPEGEKKFPAKTSLVGIKKQKIKELMMLYRKIP